MDYESTRSGVEMQMEQAKLKAQEDAAAYNLSGDVPDPNWAQPAESKELSGAGLDQAQGLWMNDGNQGGNISNAEFNHDLPTLAKNGPTDLPTIPEDESVVLTTSEIQNRIAAREGPMAEQLRDAKNMTVDETVNQVRTRHAVNTIEEIGSVLGISVADIHTGIKLGLYTLDSLNIAANCLRV